MANYNIINTSALALKSWVQEQNYYAKVPTPKNNQIVYITTDNAIITFNTELEVSNDGNNVVSKYGEDIIAPMVEKIVSHEYFADKEYGIITFNEDVTELNGFMQQTTLKAIVYPETVTTIGNAALLGCTSLERFDILPTVTEIKSNAFSGCTSITSLTIPENITEIGSYIFKGCTSLVSVELNAQITQLTSSLFRDCTALENIQFNSTTLEEICDQAFAGTNLKKIVLPTTIKKLSGHSFAGCQVEEIILNEGLEVIDQSVFTNCAELKRIEFPSTLQTIKDCDISLCASLEYLKYNSMPEKINSNLGRTIQALKTIEIGEGVTKISDEFFETHGYVETIILPKSLTTIGNKAFKDCYVLKNIIIPDGVTSIGQYAFSYCKALEYINIPETVETILPFAFNSCESLKKLDLHENITLSGPTFQNFSSLKELHLNCALIPGVEDFSNAMELETVIIGGNCTSLMGNIKYTPKVETVKFNVKMTSVTNAFTNAPHIEKLDVSNIAEINNSFISTNIKSLTIPSTTKILGNAFGSNQSLEFLSTYHDNFAGCFVGSFANLRTLILYHDGVAVGLDSHTEMKNFIKIYVPAAHITEYKSTYPKLARNIYTIELGENSELEEEEINEAVQSVVEYNNFITGFNTVETLEELPITKRLIIAEIDKSETLSLGEDLPAGRELHIIITNMSEESVNITFPDITEANMEIAGNETGEVTISSTGSKLYVRHY